MKGSTGKVVQLDKPNLPMTDFLSMNKHHKIDNTFEHPYVI
jgi:hypothetical protein